MGTIKISTSIALGPLCLQWGLFIVLAKTICFFYFLGINKVFCFLSGSFLYRNWFIKVVGVGFTYTFSNAIFLGNSGSHAILKVLLACCNWSRTWHYSTRLNCSPSVKLQPFKCSVDCTWGQWSRWSTCSATCGSGGSKTRQRPIATLAQAGGEECQGDWEEIQNCTSGMLCPVDCTWGQWSRWSTCSQTCGSGGIKTRQRPIALAQAGGEECLGEKEETTSCDNVACPVDCSWGQWSQWSRCFVTCGTGGRKTRPVSYTHLTLPTKA